MTNSGAVGLDYIGTGIIKLAKTEFLPAITHIINLSIKQSKFPVQFKKAKVIPLHKSGDRLSPQNYRPVAILPIWSKILERAIFVQMIDYFESNNLLHPNHHGFRANHNTTTALLQMYDYWVEAMDRGEATGVCFLDMSAAFDMVNHSVLLEKLLLYGFDTASFTWIKSYLEDRKQTVCIDGTCSPLLCLDTGVPQGSIIGPLLYIVFTNDLPETVHGHLPPQEHSEEHQHPQDSPEHSYNLYCDICGNICCFADDSSFSYSSKDTNEISEVLTDKYNIIAEYMQSHQLKLNGDKTHLMLLLSDAARRSRPNNSVNLDTGSETIYPTKCEKLLGGFIGQNLKFTEHIRDNEHSMIKVLNKRLNALKKVSKFASFKSRKMISNGIIISKLVYLIPVWSGCESYLMNSLQIIQNKAARIVTKCGRRTPIKSLLDQCGWLSVAQLGVFHSLVLVYKILKTGSPKYLYSKLSGVQGSTHYKTRFIQNLNENQNIVLGPDSQAESDIARRSFKYRASKQWNNLPIKMRQAETEKEFKNQLKTWIMRNVPVK